MARLRIGDFTDATIIRKDDNRFKFGSIWHWEHIRDGRIIDAWTQGNVCTAEGINHMLNVTFHGTTAIGTWYVAIFESNTTPTDGTTYATPVFTECTAYDEANRPAYNEAAASGKSITNEANKAVFTMNATKTIYGSALVGGGTGGNTKGDTAGGGTLFCASKYAEAKSVVSGDILQVWISITGADT